MEKAKSLKTVWVIMVLAFSAILVTAVLGYTASDEQRSDVLYSCNCGPDCKCGSVSTNPGNCACGKPMKWGHVVKIDGDEAKVCTCAEGCKCSIDPNDPSKCGCGNTLKKISLKGTGIYYCNCGSSCSCNTVSDKPGKCKCGMDLKKSG